MLVCTTKQNTEGLMADHARHASLDCASSDSRSARALMVSPYLVTVTAGFDGKSKPADGSR